MKRILFAVLATATLFVAMNETEAEAGRFRRSSFRSTSNRRAVSSHRYSRARHIDGRTHWDLGKQNGQWPSNL